MFPTPGSEGGGIGKHYSNEKQITIYAFPRTETIFHVTLCESSNSQKCKQNCVQRANACFTNTCRTNFEMFLYSGQEDEKPVSFCKIGEKDIEL